MRLKELKQELSNLSSVAFILPSGEKVPSHFHITEAGRVTKDFIDCGGTVRSEKKLQLQLWTSIDYHHRLSAEKFLKILEIYEKNFGDEDLEIEVEYQGDTINKYSLSFDDDQFYLNGQKTDCLAKENCGIPVIGEVVKNANAAMTSCCGSESNCC